MNGDAKINPWEGEATICCIGVTGLAWLGLGPLLLVGRTIMEIKTNGAEGGGSDDGMVMMLVGEIIWGVDVGGVGLCHWKGDSNVEIGWMKVVGMTIVTSGGGFWAKMGVTTYARVGIVELGEDILEIIWEVEIESVPIRVGLFFLLFDGRGALAFWAFLLIV